MFECPLAVIDRLSRDTEWIAVERVARQRTPEVVTHVGIQFSVRFH